mgnify:CR=1 FL=1
MNDFIKKYADLLKDDSGVKAIDLEMKRQYEDAAQTMNDQKETIEALAAVINACPRILLLGMGASHFVNEVFAFQLRRFGIEAAAMTASEFLYDTIPTADKVVILTSQSGESVETVKCFSLLPSETPVFSVTLSPESTSAAKTQAIVCSGGPEKAYAGTRSVTLSLAAFAFVSAALGQIPQESVLRALAWERTDYSAMEKAVWTLFSKRDIVVTGRSLFSPLGGLFALGCEELSNRPILYNETGTFRHGPMEVLGEDTALVVFRQKGLLGELCRSFNDVQQKSGCAVIVLDASGQEPLSNAITIPCQEGDDIVAVLGMMTTFQLLMIAYACGKNPRAGLPRYGSKITTSE